MVLRLLIVASLFPVCTAYASVRQGRAPSGPVNERASCLSADPDPLRHVPTAFGDELNGDLPIRVLHQIFQAFSGCLLAQAPTLAGGAVGRLWTPGAASEWLTYPLAVAGGFLFYLGFHAVHGEWKRRGARAAFTPALAGAAGAAVLQQGARVLFG